MTKKLSVRSRLHEQRERPERSLMVTLENGTIVEELDWDRETENTKIHSRYLLDKFEWFEDKKYPIR